MAELPSGIVTFVFTDIEGSTRLFQRLGPRYEALLQDHRRLLRSAFATAAGHEITTEGDSFFVAFERASDALAACLEGQRALAGYAWPDDAVIRVRMGIHSGEATPVGTDYVALAVHQASRVASVAHGGQVVVSESAANLAAHNLPPRGGLLDLGMHRLKDLAEPFHLFQLTHPDVPVEFPPLRSLEAHTHNLPSALTSFVGREQELGDVGALLASVRLLTITGPPGCGKTRLALQAAGAMLERRPDGVWLIDLAPVADPALVAQTTVSALRLPSRPGATAEQTLVGYLEDKALLLVLDNCERVAEECGRLAEELLRGCPDLRILATSQVSLGTSGETALSLAPFPVPVSGVTSPAEVAGSDAVELFIERAKAADVNMTPSDEDLLIVAQIVRRLDGIPLAIELAAARVRTLDLAEIASRLDDRFRLLTTGARMAPERQQTLRAAVDWSHELLSMSEGTLFRRLAVFTGTFALEAAEEVCAGGDVSKDDVLELMSQLVERSLVVKERVERRGRYRLFDSIRQYALERLIASGELAEVQGRHLSWFLALAERASLELTGPEQAAWIDRLILDEDDLRAALERSVLDPTPAEEGLRLTGALSMFWFFRGVYREGLSWFDRALSGGGGERSAVRGRALWGAGFLATILGETDRARPLLDGSLAMSREAHDDSGIARSLDYLGLLAFFDDDLVGALALFEESAEVARQAGDAWCLADALGTLGSIYPLSGQLQKAQQVADEALQMSRRAGDHGGVRMALFGTALAAHFSGDLERARSQAEEGLAISRDLGDLWFVSYFLWILAGVALDQGHYVSAQSQAEESLAIARGVEGPLLITCALEVCGCASRALGDEDGARGRLEEADAIARSGGVPKSYHAAVLRASGELAMDRDDDPAARAFIERSLDVGREVRDEVNVARSLCTLGILSRRGGALDQADALLGEALARQTAMGATLTIPTTLEATASLRVDQGDHEVAAMLLGGAARLREEMGSPFPPWSIGEHDRVMNELAEALGSNDRARAIAKGRSIPVEDLAR